MADVFLSYSRRDSDLFVHHRAPRSTSQGKEVWLDTGSIADAEVFPQAIRSAIETSDAFLFVITPEAVSSAYCEQEVTYAGELGKRIVPVLRQPVEDSEIPREIRERNWIPFTDDAEFDSATDRVVQALDTDLEHRKEHTRWLVKSIEWDSEGRDRSFLLRGSELKAAEKRLVPGSDFRSTHTVRPDPHDPPERIRPGQPAGRGPAGALPAGSQRGGDGRGHRTRDHRAGVAEPGGLDGHHRPGPSPRGRESEPAHGRSRGLGAPCAPGRAAAPHPPGRRGVAPGHGRLPPSESPCPSTKPVGSVRRHQQRPSVAYSPTGGRVAEVACSNDVVVLDAAISGAVVSVDATSRDRPTPSVTTPPAARWRWAQAPVSTSSIRRRERSCRRASVTPARAQGPRVVRGGRPGRGPGPAPAPQRATGGRAQRADPGGTQSRASPSMPPGSQPGSDDLPGDDGVGLWRQDDRCSPSPSPRSDETLAFTPDGRSLVVGTQGPAEVVDVASGRIVKRLSPSGQPSPPAAERTRSPSRGTVLVVGQNVSGPGT